MANSKCWTSTVCVCWIRASSTESFKMLLAWLFKTSPSVWLNSCSTLRKIYIGLGGTTFVPPRYEALIYGIVENDKVNRMGLSKIYVDKMYEINMHKMERSIK